MMIDRPVVGSGGMRIPIRGVVPMDNDYLSPKKKCLFDPRVMDKIRKKALGKPIEKCFEIIIDGLDRAYPGHVCKKQNWIFNNAGGAMGQLSLIHASLREYVIFFGTCIGTEGHSGRYSSEVFDFMLKGEMRCEYEGRFKAEVHVPSGKPAYLGNKVVKHYCVKNEAWMLEYARGSIIRMLPFGLCDSIFSTLDVRTIFRIMKQYAKLTIKELLTKGKDIDLVIKFILIAALLACLYVFYPAIRGFFL